MCCTIDIHVRVELSFHGFINRGLVINSARKIVLFDTSIVQHSAVL